MFLVVARNFPPDIGGTQAIMGVNSALITIYDLSKIVNPHLKIDNVKLLIKEGGKSGLWKNPDGLPDFLKNIF